MGHKSKDQKKFSLIYTEECEVFPCLSAGSGLIISNMYLGLNLLYQYSHGSHSLDVFLKIAINRNKHYFISSVCLNGLDNFAYCRGTVVFPMFDQSQSSR